MTQERLELYYRKKFFNCLKQFYERWEIRIRIYKDSQTYVVSVQDRFYQQFMCIPTTHWYAGMWQDKYNQIAAICDGYDAHLTALCRMSQNITIPAFS